MSPLQPSLSRRRFLSSAGLLSLGLATGLRPTSLLADSTTSPFNLPPLPYPYDALEPVIDRLTMEIHHQRHHQGYANGYRKALAGFPDLLAGDPSLPLRQLHRFPQPLRQSLINSGGGFINHNLFWQIMDPNGGDSTLSPRLAERLDAAFGSFTSFKEQFSQAAASQFGSGWAWLILRPDASLQITSTPNQVNPIMQGLLPDDQVGVPLLGLDVWEHAYYLKYQNRRGDYIANWWQVVSWPRVELELDTALSTSRPTL
ncbi:MAG: superoxide dismutase [Puniceicoccaceae bacterium]